MPARTNNAGDGDGSDPVAGPTVPKPSPFDTKEIDLISIDFRKVYDTYLFQLAERSIATRLFVTLFSAPFIFVTAIATTGGIKLTDGDVLSTMRSLPPFTHIVIIAAGIIGLIPFHRFWAAHCQTYKMTRYINNYRKLYWTLFKGRLSDLKWAPGAEIDPEMPVVTAIGFHWAYLMTLIMMVANTGYVVIGAYFIDPARSLIAPILAGFVMLALHLVLYVKEREADDIGRRHVLLERIEE